VGGAGDIKRAELLVWTASHAVTRLASPQSSLELQLDRYISSPQRCPAHGVVPGSDEVWALVHMQAVNGEEQLEGRATEAGYIHY